MANKISFHFHPCDIENKNHTVEKSDASGVKNKYLVGVSSGSKVDGHGERITEKCIKSFTEQANSGTILLYPDTHGIKQSDDIGILTKGEILPDGNWKTEYRLYRPDECGAQKAEKIDTIWRQVNGISPYPRPIQKGFSIEGYIPDDGVINAEKDSFGQMRNRVIDNISLDGVVLVPRPAYQDSIANAIYKALGEMTPESEQRTRLIIKSRLGERIEKSEMNDGYYRKKWEINDALENEIEMIMKSDRKDKAHRIGVLFEEHAQIMSELIMKSESLFVDEKGAEDKSLNRAVNGKLPRVEILKSLATELGRLKSLYAR